MVPSLSGMGIWVEECQDMPGQYPLGCHRLYSQLPAVSLSRVDGCEAPACGTSRAPCKMVQPQGSARR